MTLLMWKVWPTMKTQNQLCASQLCGAIYFISVHCFGFMAALLFHIICVIFSSKQLFSAKYCTLPTQPLKQMD